MNGMYYVLYVEKNVNQNKAREVARERRRKPRNCMECNPTHAAGPFEVTQYHT